MTTRQRWISESLDGNINPISTDDAKPINCRMLMQFEGVTLCFLVDPYPGFFDGEELAEIIEESKQNNLKRYGTSDPGKAIIDLDQQYDAERPDPNKIKIGLEVLKGVYDLFDILAIQLEDVPEHHPKFNPWMRERAAGYREEAKAIAQAIRITEKFHNESK